ncbi:MAG: FAD-binding protein, partial [Betaproteobacteria bacterium]
MKAELLAEHAARSAQAAAQMRALAAVPAAASTTAPLRLTKRTSNLFRDRAAPRRRLDLSAFGHVLAIDREAMQFDAEGLVAYEDLV